MKSSQLTSFVLLLFFSFTFHSSTLLNSQDEEITKQKLIKVLKQGADAWNEFRESHPENNFESLLKESNLAGMDFSNMNLKGINFKEATLTGANFAKANLEGANLKEALVTGTNFQKANLKGVNMKEVALIGCNFQKANLEGANMKEVTLKGSNFTKANLCGVIMHEAEIKESVFQGAVADGSTTFPPGFDTEKHGIVMK